MKVWAIYDLHVVPFEAKLNAHVPEIMGREGVKVCRIRCARVRITRTAGVVAVHATKLRRQAIMTLDISVNLPSLKHDDILYTT